MGDLLGSPRQLSGTRLAKPVYLSLKAQVRVLGGRKTSLGEPDGVGGTAIHGSHCLCGARGGWRFKSGVRKTGLGEPDGVGGAAVHSSHSLCVHSAIGVPRDDRDQTDDQFSDDDSQEAHEIVPISQMIDRYDHFDRRGSKDRSWGQRSEDPSMPSFLLVLEMFVFVKVGVIDEQASSTSVKVPDERGFSLVVITGLFVSDGIILNRGKRGSSAAVAASETHQLATGNKAESCQTRGSGQKQLGRKKGVRGWDGTGRDGDEKRKKGVEEKEKMKERREGLGVLDSWE
ncbi:hypothetical protein Sjap_003427 [Stephania japonica]|uniref:Uncharacterized protein n=1 Tax=Stephania japonica TaxID=461633 RepID=A0AAP0PTK5_9MAGN